MFKSLFGNKYIEKVLFFILVNDRCYPTQLKNRFGCSISPIQLALERLEEGGIVVSFLEGKTRIYQFNPRYPFLKELRELLKKAYAFIPEDIRKSEYEPPSRKRPRKKGKKL